MKDENPLNYLFLEDEPINYREVLGKYLYHWKWFVITVIIALLGAYLHLRYTANEYKVATTILIDDEENGGLPSELSAFEDLGLMGGGKKAIETEIGLLKSRSLMESVVKDLGIYATYFRHGRVRAVELYKNDVPFKINFFPKDATFYKIDTVFTIQKVSETHFKLGSGDKKQSKQYVFGENIKMRFGDITVTPSATASTIAYDEISVHITNLRKVAQGFLDATAIELLYKKSSLIELSLQSTVKAKAQDILNGLVKQYNKNGIEDKNLIATNTEVFINERLAVIEKDLMGVDKSVEDFKTSNKLTDIPSEASLVLENNSEVAKQLVDLHTQLKLADYIMAYLKDHKEALIPANLGLNDATVNSNSSRYNELLLERNRIIESSSDKHPVIVNLNSQLKELRTSISQSLVNFKSSIQITLRDVQKVENNMQSRLYAVPKQEREFRDMQRQQQITETLYLYLLEKREENAITLAVTVPNAKVVDSADGSDVPVAPKRKIIYLLALIVGVLVPFTVLYIRFLLDNKVHNTKDIEGVLKAPLVGEIPNTTSTNKIVVSENDRDSIAESFRMLRTNVNFMLSSVKEGGKTIFVTSTVAGEGKTFIALNIASVLALTNKKVLLIGADIRKPKFIEYLNVTFDKGLTHFLMDTTVQVNELVHRFDALNFDVVGSGIVPPNPSELLMNGRFEELLAYGKQHYDYVIVDTAPIKLVTDTLLLCEQADLNLYIVRANYLDKRLLEIPEKLFHDHRLKNMGLVLNDADFERGYGYGYGYGYGNSYGYGYGNEADKKPWWKRMFKK